MLPIQQVGIFGIVCSWNAVLGLRIAIVLCKTQVLELVIVTGFPGELHDCHIAPCYSYQCCGDVIHKACVHAWITYWILTYLPLTKQETPLLNVRTTEGMHRWCTRQGKWTPVQHYSHAFSRLKSHILLQLNECHKSLQTWNSRSNASPLWFCKAPNHTVVF